jgi:hypothetical protein
VTQEFDVSAEELLRTLKRRGIPLPSEIGAFITLEACEHVLDRPAVLTTNDVAISEIGEVLCVDGLAPASEADAVRALLVLLGELLVCAAPGVPSMLLDLAERGPSQRQPTLSGLLGDLEACLVPLNRGATRRVLARLVRETRKAGPSMRMSSRPAPAELDAQFDALMSGKGRSRPSSAAVAPARPRAAFSEDQPTRPFAGKGAVAGAAASAFAAPGAPAAAVVARARVREPEPDTRPKSPFPESVESSKPAAAPSAAAAAAILRARTSDGPQLQAANVNDRSDEPPPRAWPPSRAVVRSPSGSLPAGTVPVPQPSAAGHAGAAPQPSAAGHAAAPAQPSAAGYAGVPVQPLAAGHAELTSEDERGIHGGRDTARALPHGEERADAQAPAGTSGDDADAEHRTARAIRTRAERPARAREAGSPWVEINDDEDGPPTRRGRRALEAERARLLERDARDLRAQAERGAVGAGAEAGPAAGGGEEDVASASGTAAVSGEGRGASIRDAADRAAARAREARRNAGQERTPPLRPDSASLDEALPAQPGLDVDFVDDEGEPTLKRNMKGLQAGDARRSRSPGPATTELANLDEVAEERAARGRLGLWIFGLSTAGALALLAIYFAFGRDNARHALGLDAKTQQQEAPKSTAPARPAVGDLVITSQPGRAQVLLLIGPGPALATDLPLGVAQEFVAIADGYAPARAVVPADAAWEDASGQPRYELAIQADRAKNPAQEQQLGATLLPRDVGTPQARLGSVRVVTTPRGAKVYQLIGFTPDVRVENLPLDQSYELLIYLEGRAPVIRHVAAADFHEQHGKRSAEVSVDFDAK